MGDPMADPRVRMFPIHRREDRCAVCGARVTVSHYDKDLRGPVGPCCLEPVLRAQDALNLHVVPPGWEP